MRSWPVIPLQYALQLVDHKYPDERVHEYAVKCLREAIKEEKCEMNRKFSFLFSSKLSIHLIFSSP